MRDLNYPNDNCDTFICKLGIKRAFQNFKKIENRTRNTEVREIDSK